MFALQVDQEIDHLGLDRYVERRHRLVAHDQARTERERARDADALALTAGKLMRKILHLVGSQAHLLEQLGNPLALFVARGEAVDAERLADDIARPHTRG